jgi:hypothetical protein
MHPIKKKRVASKSLKASKPITGDQKTLLPKPFLACI